MSVSSLSRFDSPSGIPHPLKKSRPSHSTRRARSSALLQALEPRLLMTTLYWDPSAVPGLQSGSGAWSTTAANWNTAADGSGSRVRWINGADAVFKASGTSTVTVSAAISANTVTFAGTGYTVTGAKLTLTGAASIIADQNATISSPIAGKIGLSKLGQATLTLSGKNAYAGGTAVKTGTLQIQPNATLGDGNISVTGTLAINTSALITLAAAITGTGTLAVLGSGTLALTANNSYGNTSIARGATLCVGATSGGTTGTLGTGTVQNDGDLVFSRANPVTLANAITGTGNLIKRGGNSVLTLAAANTFTGTARIQTGTLTLANPQALANATLNMTQADSGQLSLPASANVSLAGLTGNRGITLPAATTLTLALKSVMTYTGLLSGQGSLKTTGGGTLALGGTNTFSGGTTLAGGNLLLRSKGALGTTGTINFSGGTLQYSSANTTDYSPRFSTQPDQHYAIDTGGQTITFASALSSARGSLAKLGDGTLLLTRAATYSGITAAAAGRLIMPSDWTVSSAGASVAAGARMDIYAAPTIYMAGASISGIPVQKPTFFVPSTIANAGTLHVAGDLTAALSQIDNTGTVLLAADVDLSGQVLTGGTFQLLGGHTATISYGPLTLNNATLHIDAGATVSLVEATIRSTNNSKVINDGLVDDRPGTRFFSDDNGNYAPSLQAIIDQANTIINNVDPASTNLGRTIITLPSGSFLIESDLNFYGQGITLSGAANMSGNSGGTELLFDHDLDGINSGFGIYIGGIGIDKESDTNNTYLPLQQVSTSRVAGSPVSTLTFFGNVSSQLKVGQPLLLSNGIYGAMAGGRTLELEYNRNELVGYNNELAPDEVVTVTAITLDASGNTVVTLADPVAGITLTGSGAIAHNDYAGNIAPSGNITNARNYLNVAVFAQLPGSATRYKIADNLTLQNLAWTVVDPDLSYDIFVKYATSITLQHVSNLTPQTIAPQSGMGIVSSSGVTVDDLQSPSFIQLNSARNSSVINSTVRTIAMEECCDTINLSDNIITNTWYGLEGTEWSFTHPYVSVVSIYSTDMSCRNITVHHNICSGGAYMMFIGVNFTITDNTLWSFPYFSNGFNPNLIELEIVDGCQVTGNVCQGIGYNTTTNHAEIIPYLKYTPHIHDNFTVI